MVEEEKDLDGRLARMIIGKDDTATSELMGYRFKYHSPSMIEQLQIQVQASNLRIGAVQGDMDLRVLTTMISTFDVLCDEIIKVKTDDGLDLNPVMIESLKDAKGNVSRNLGFWEFLQGKKNPLLFEKLLIPLYNDFLKFQGEISLKYDDLKN